MYEESMENKEYTEETTPVFEEETELTTCETDMEPVATQPEENDGLSTLAKIGFVAVVGLAGYGATKLVPAVCRGGKKVASKVKKSIGNLFKKNKDEEEKSEKKEETEESDSEKTEDKE